LERKPRRSLPKNYAVIGWRSVATEDEEYELKNWAHVIFTRARSGLYRSEGRLIA
jgi:hypothetical protein